MEARIERRATRSRLMTSACVALSIVTMAACGDDEESSDTTAAPTTEAAAETEESSDTTAPPTTEAPAVTEAPTATEVAGADSELCELATEMDQQEDFPSEAQLTKYQELAPPEVADAVNTAAGPLIAAEGDMVAFFNAAADDDVEAAIVVINAFETENCGIDHSDDSPPADDTTSYEVEDDATRVDVTATDYEFALDSDTLAAGRTSFVLTNNGQEAHFLGVTKLVDGKTLDDMMNSDDSEGIVEGEWGSHLAAAGGDTEALSLDLEPGNYVLACWISAADGTPHAMLGMTKEFVVE